MFHSIQLRAALILTIAAFLSSLPGAPSYSTTGLTFTIPCGDTAALIASIDAANRTAEEDVLHLAPGCEYIFFRTAEGEFLRDNALPLITAPLTIYGHSAKLLRSSSGTTPEFRFIQSQPGVSVLIDSITMENGGSSLSTLSGGAVYSAGPLTITNSRFKGNQAVNGGALYLFDSAIIRNSLFDDNHATNEGGAVFAIPKDGLSETISSVTNSTFADNSAQDGFSVMAYTAVALQHDTIVGNTAVSNERSYPSAVVNRSLTGMELANSILDNAPFYDCKGQVSDQGGNLQYGTSCGNSIESGSALLGSLQDNGGPTETFALLPGSQAIDTGVPAYCLPTDQRGSPRPNGSGCDAGSFEARGMVTGHIQALPYSILSGEPAQVTISLINTTGEPLSNVELAGTLPDKLAFVSETNNNTCGGHFTTNPVATGFILTGASLETGQSCNVQFTISGAEPGQYILSGGEVTTLPGGTTSLYSETPFIVKTGSELLLERGSGTVRTHHVVTVSAVVQPVLQGLVFPQGEIEYVVSGPERSKTWTGTAVLMNGSTEIPFIFETPGQYLINAFYQGNDLFNPSAVEEISIIVQEAVYLPVTRR